MPNRVRVLMVPDADGVELERLPPVDGGPGPGGGAGSDRLAGGTWKN
jgi:hypothetical protein